MDVGSGGLIAVDPRQLRDVAARVGAQGESVQRAAGDMRAVAQVLEPLPQAPSGVLGAAAEIALCAGRIADLSVLLNQAADTYELVELNARMLMERHGDDGGGLLTHLEMRRRELLERSPRAGAEADALLAAWRREHGVEALQQFGTGSGMLLAMFGLSGGSLMLHALLHSGTRGLQHSGLGRLPRRQRLTGHALMPRIARPRFSTGTAPTSTADLAGRIPDGDRATIRVERYAMPDGVKEYAVYVAGTQTEEGTVLDGESNLRLYQGERSQAFEAVEAALEAAGAEPGDAVHAAGFSQGAMVAAWLKAEDRFDVRTLVMLGSPVDIDAGGEALVVAIRHDDDLVPLLAGGGYPHATGAEGSVLVTDAVDPGPSLADVALPAHRLTAYAETAAEFDASGDPRALEVAAQLSRLRAAESVEVFEYLPRKNDGEPGGTAF